MVGNAPVTFLETTRRECWRIIAERYPESRNKHAIFKELVERTVVRGNRILDAGCGRWSVVCDWVHVTRIGIDAVLEDVARNDSIDYGICSNLECLPLKDTSVDVIVSSMVFEHLRRPEDVFAEFRRVLTKGGHLIFMTPNIFNIVTMIGRMVPYRFHPGLATGLTGVRESDVFPTYYRANSVTQLHKLLRRNGFDECETILYQPPPYAFVFSKVICKLAIQYYHLINRHDALQHLRGVIISSWRKV